MRTFFTTLICVLAAGAIALAAGIFFADKKLEAQTTEPNAEHPAPRFKPRSKPKQAPARPVAQTAAPAASNAPVRTEQIVYDRWTVVCREIADGKTKKICSATLPMQMQQNNKVINLGGWVIAHNKNGALMSVLETPQIDIGVLIAKGVQIKFGADRPRMFSYLSCNPRRCETAIAMDDATIREMSAAPSAAVTIWKADGGEFTINIPSIKGIDKAIAAVR